MEPIAVIGIGCRFPGDANSPEEFWQLLADGRDLVREVPQERYDIDAVYHPDVKMPGKTVSRWGSYLNHIDQFDAAFFGISPREAMFMDPRQRILLEVAWEALERAGLPPESLTGSSSGVFMGLFNNDYKDCIFEVDLENSGASIDHAYVPLGNGLSFASGRISYLLGLQGPSMVVDTVCSSSLVAVHLACQSLRNNECGPIALAGAVDLNFHPFGSITTSKMRVYSPSGRCRTFDAGADGFVRGEGCGVLVLKRQSQAVADGDTILALIRGSAVNHNGRSNGLTVPSAKAQAAVLRQALQNAGVAPGQISYVEAHGTGTKRGDPIEFEALKAVIGDAHPEGSVCRLGSVKTNVGHLLASAGMAGLVKTIMCLQHGAIPPHLHLETLNPLINLQHTPFVIPRQLSSWPVSAGPRYAGVSASGLSGTNAHVVLEEVLQAPGTNCLSSGPPGQTWLLPLSAKNVDGLRQLAETWHGQLQSTLSNVPLRRICSTASLRRTHHQQRLALVAADHGELATQLEAFLREAPAPGISSGLASSASTRPVFVFSGQGAQWATMGQELFKQEPVFRTSLEECDAILRRHVSWSLLEELQATEGQSRLHETAVAQPAIFSIQVALSNLWRSWGIEPAAVAGHSVGEITSAYVAGIYDLEDAIRIVAERGKLMQKAHGLGYMAAVEISEMQVQEFLVDYADRVAIAAINSPTSIVLSGETTALHEILQNMQKCNIPSRKLNVESAFHSPQMDHFLHPLAESLQGITPAPGTLLLLSTVTGEAISGEELDAVYWGRNMCQTVRFSPAIEKLVDMGYSTFLEISPQTVLRRSLKQCLAHHRRSGLVLSSMHRGLHERTTMLTALGTLYANGFPVKWEELYPAGREPGQVVQLPTYPWQHKHYWFSERKPLSQHAIRTASPGRLTGHPLLLRRVRSATRNCIFESTISTKSYPWLADHQASGMIIFPASAYIEMMHESVRMAFNYGDLRASLTDFFVHQALTLSSPEQERVVQLVLQPSTSHDNLAGEMNILSCSENEDGDVWTLHASGKYQPDKQAASKTSIPAECTELDTVRQRCSQSTEAREHYKHMEASGLTYGPAFQGLQQIWWREGETLGHVRLPQQLAREKGSYFMHPAFLDACIHTTAAAINGVGSVASNGEGGIMYLPLSMDRVLFYQRPGDEIWVHITILKSDLKQASVVAKVNILTKQGEPIALIDGLHLRRASRVALAGVPRGVPAKNPAPQWLHKIQWDQKPYQGGHMAVSPRSWLFFCDNNGVGKQLVEHMRARGEQCFVIFVDQRCEKKGREDGHFTLDPTCPEHFVAFLQDCVKLFNFPRCSIVYLWAMNAAVTPDAPSELLMEEQRRFCGGLLHLVQAVAQRRWATSPQLWVVTQNCQDVSGLWDGRVSGVAQGSVWGLGRVIAYEHPDLSCRLVDVPDQASWDDQRFIEELLDPEPEDQIALLMEGRYVARFVEAESATESLPQLRQHGPTTIGHKGGAQLLFTATGTYLITGGLGGLGMEIAQFMVEKRGVRHLVLTGRRPPSPEVLSVIHRLEKGGAQILITQTDVADRKQVAAMLETIKQTAPPLRGVIHAAGILDDGVLVQLSWARFANVMGPKMHGSWNLHLLTRDMPLDFFALFSSVASVMPAPGQANYAAANAFMDGLAHYRRSLGLPAISINWGAWANVGMTKDSASFDRRLERDGVQLISVEGGMATFEQLLLDNPIQRTVFLIDWSLFRGVHRSSPMFEKVSGENRVHVSSSVAAAAADGSEAMIKQQPYAVRILERPQILLEDVSRLALQVLGHDTMSSIEWGWNLFEMGFDSFMAIELRNALQKETAISLPANLVFDHSTVKAIAAYVGSQLSPESEMSST